MSTIGATPCPLHTQPHLTQAEVWHNPLSCHACVWLLFACGYSIAAMLNDDLIDRLADTAEDTVAVAIGYTAWLWTPIVWADARHRPGLMQAEARRLRPPEWVLTRRWLRAKDELPQT